MQNAFKFSVKISAFKTHEEHLFMSVLDLWASVDLDHTVDVLSSSAAQENPSEMLCGVFTDVEVQRKAGF